jgi:hypothetical protein
MHDKPIGAGYERATLAEQDTNNQTRVLREVLFIYPEAMTLEELIRELTFASKEFAERDAIRQAVRDLVAGGLVHQVGDLVLPTRAAVNYYVLGEV